MPLKQSRQLQSSSNQSLKPRFAVYLFADEPLVAQALAALLALDRSIAAKAVASLDEASEALDGAAGFGVLLVMTSHAGAELIDSLATVRSRRPEAGFCLIADSVDHASLRRMLSGSPGALALIRRSSKPILRDLVVTLYSLAGGRAVVPPQLLETLVADGDSESQPWDSISERDRDVAELVAAGLRNCDIGRRLGCSTKAVERVVGRLYERLGLDNGRERRVLLARSYLTQGAGARRDGISSPVPSH